MRKYDIKNKRNIGIIIVISVVIIIMFSLFIRLFLSSDKKEYQVPSGTLAFDKDKTMIKVDDSAIIKTKWNNEYYLLYNDYDYELGDTATLYNETTGEIYLYGRYYEISSGDFINITKDETVIKSSALTKFYKLADRKYLIIDKDIKSADGILSTSDFLMVDIDKVGNATLTNHKVSLKVFSATTIVTSNYTFDIANEILTYGSDKIDLKKIIGSTNTYTKEDLIPEENNQTGTSNNSNGSTGVVDNSTDNNGNGNGNLGGRNETVIEEIKKEAKRTSVISVNSTTSKIIVDYVIYDPKKEYTSVYMEVMNLSSNKVETIYLNSNSTVYEISNSIFPNTTYELTFKYSYLDENNDLKVEEFDKARVTTKLPGLSIEVARVKYGMINYLVTTDNTYPITSATVVVLVNGSEEGRKEIAINGNTTDSINISNLKDGDIVELKLMDVKSGDNIINDLGSSYKFRY